VIRFKVKGGFSKTVDYLERLKRFEIRKILDRYGKAGVAALSSATPVDTGLTASSWYYKIEVGANTTSLIFCNSNVQNGVPIAIILQYGHGTGTGGYVQGRDYINPAIQPVFDDLVKKAREEVTRV
jgi:hypothetical protein